MQNPHKNIFFLALVFPFSGNLTKHFDFHPLGLILAQIHIGFLGTE